MIRPCLPVPVSHSLREDQAPSSSFSTESISEASSGLILLESSVDHRSDDDRHTLVLVKHPYDVPNRCLPSSDTTSPSTTT